MLRDFRMSFEMPPRLIGFGEAIRSGSAVAAETGERRIILAVADRLSHASG